jgi:superfamily II DNA or RNA helicase/HKD family nuclease
MSSSDNRYSSIVPTKLAAGLHERPLTTALSRSLENLAPSRSELRGIDDADLAEVLASQLRAELTKAFGALTSQDARLALTEKLLTLLAAETADPAFHDQALAPPPRILGSIYLGTPPRRPSTPLTLSTLLTRNRFEPALAHEISCEVDSADSVDLIAAFITVGGVRTVREALESLARRGARLRVLTTVFNGITEIAALDALARFPHAEVRVSYDTRRTRLHAKAWLFQRDAGLHSAYIGSANVTATALTSGHEWTVKVCAADLPQVIEKFRGTFASLWSDAEFERYDPEDPASRERLRVALRDERSVPEGSIVPLFSLRPFPYQQDILDRLAIERQVHGRMRNLVVAATGTGKTVIAALDYARLAEEKGTSPRLLFVAHRRELLEQARATFRNVLHEGAFGELLADGLVPDRWEHVFATVQTASRLLPERVTADHFEHVIVDECHHAPAESYQRMMQFLSPRTLVGLTATPERSDGQSLLGDFDGTIAAELRLWHALEQQLLVPFEYYGISDGTDLTRVRWTRTGYDQAALAQVYTGNDARVDLVVAQLGRRVVDPRRVRAIAFCVSIEHAEFMARALSARGIPAAAVHGGTRAAERAEAPRRLRERDVNVLCTCDLYNEGVDLPFVDTLLFLRPTASATVFLQQLGRGLRLSIGKQSCLVLDFIGHHRADFRFDDLYTALLDVPRAKLEGAVRDGFPYLPSGCVLELDAVARETVLASLKRVLPTAERLAEELRIVAGGKRITLGEFLRASGRDLEDVYRGDKGWTSLVARAGLAAPPSAEVADVTRRFGWLSHVDEAARLRTWQAAANGDDASLADDLYRRRLTMLDFQLQHRGVVRDPADTVRYLAGNEAVRVELNELATVLSERISVAQEVYPVGEWPLALHQRYSRREIVAAVGFVKPGQKGRTPQGGILKLDDEQRELLFVTLDKSGKSFSPNTRYRDYAISPTSFHWETQAAASVSRPSGQRYVDSPANGWRFFLFVREEPDAPDEYAFLGEARLVSAEGDRPIGITWELVNAMPARLFERFATLAQG